MSQQTAYTIKNIRCSNWAVVLNADEADVAAGTSAHQDAGSKWIITEESNGNYQLRNQRYSDICASYLDRNFGNNNPVRTVRDSQPKLWRILRNGRGESYKIYTAEYGLCWSLPDSELGTPVELKESVHSDRQCWEIMSDDGRTLIESDDSKRSNAIRILSLDGGGMRGYASLLILREIVYQIRRNLKLSAKKTPLPCELFDLICGTGTGGLIALLLGRLRMSVDDAIVTFIKLSRDVYEAPISHPPCTSQQRSVTLPVGQSQQTSGSTQPSFQQKISTPKVPSRQTYSPPNAPQSKSHSKSEAPSPLSQETSHPSLSQLHPVRRQLDDVLLPQFDHEKLEHAIMKIVGERAGDPMAPICSEVETACHTCVLAVHKDSQVKGLTLLRTYDSPKEAASTCPIWQAARATSAQPSFFRAAKVEFGPGVEAELVDAGMGHNNPTEEAINEAKRLWGQQTIGCILSIGTGHPKLLSVSDGSHGTMLVSAAKTCVSIAEDCEATHERLSKTFLGSPDVYFRFNADRGLEDIPLTEWEDNNRPKMLAFVSTYLRLTTVDKQKDKCANILSDSYRVSEASSR